jgi:hypothetical protein
LSEVRRQRAIQQQKANGPPYQSGHKRFVHNHFLCVITAFTGSTFLHATLCDNLKSARRRKSLAPQLRFQNGSRRLVQVE